MRILVTTDGSERSLRVLPHVGALADAAGSELVLFRVLDPLIDCASELATSLEAAVEAVSRRWREQLGWALSVAGVEGRPQVTVRRHGEEVRDAIIRFAAESGATMLAMDSRGAGALRHAIFGSVALGVLAKSHLPVMTTGTSAGEARRGGEYRLIVTSDGSRAAADVVAALAPFLKGDGIRLVLLRVYQPALGDSGDRQELAKARDELAVFRRGFPEHASVELDVRRVEAGRTVEASILAAADERAAAAIAMSTHGHSARRHLLAGSVALGVLRRATLPVILARGDGR